MKMLGYFLLVLLGLLLVWMLISALTEQGIEEPGYTVERKAEGYEVRDYESFLLAEASLPHGTEKPLQEGFQMLFDYISGANQGNRKIDMTAPVLQEGVAAEKIAMTKPVLRREEQGGSVVAFVLPADYTMQTAPVPENPDIQIREVASRRVAVLRFSGYAGEKTVEEKSRKLLSLLERDGLKPAGTVRVAYYNPPWTPPFMRRNEVMVTIE